MISFQNLTLWCKVNGEMRQTGCTSDMIIKPPDLLSFITQYITLHPGDLVLTGTPSGVGPVQPGDVIEAGLLGHVTVKFDVSL